MGSRLRQQPCDEKLVMSHKVQGNGRFGDAEERERVARCEALYMQRTGIRQPSRRWGFLGPKLLCLDPRQVSALSSFFPRSGSSFVQTSHLLIPPPFITTRLC